MTMKRILALAILMAGLGAVASAQVPNGTPHQAVATITKAATVGGSGTLQGFNLYRAPGGTTTFAKLNTSVIPAATPTFTDTTVAASTQYAYCATEVDSANTESACSPVVTVTIPSSVNPPALVVLGQ
jgi:hypothetical protein